MGWVKTFPNFSCDTRKPVGKELLAYPQLAECCASKHGASEASILRREAAKATALSRTLSLMELLLLLVPLPFRSVSPPPEGSPSSPQRNGSGRNAGFMFCSFERFVPVVITRRS